MCGEEEGRVCVWGGGCGGGGGHTKGLATDISWKLLDDVSAHQRTAPAIVGLIAKQRRHRAVVCLGVFAVCCTSTYSVCVCVCVCVCAVQYGGLNVS